MNTTEKNSLPTDADETTKQTSGEQLVQYEKIENTPFTAVRIDEKWFLTMGKYRLTEPLPDLEACQINAMDAGWDRIMQIIQIMIENNNNQKIKELELNIEQLKKQIH